jgi:AmmeMemoRadiSam system protein B
MLKGDTQLKAAGYMTADFLNLHKDQAVERVILLGPNHYLKGPRVASSRQDWHTAFGVLITIAYY